MEGREYSITGLDALALPQNRSILNLHVEKMKFLVPVGYLPLFINPDQGVLHAVAFGGGLVNADVDGEMSFAS